MLALSTEGARGFDLDCTAEAVCLRLGRRNEKQMRKISEIATEDVRVRAT